MRLARQFLLFFPLMATAQTVPFRLGDAINLIPPAVNTDGNTAVFAAAMAPDGTPQKATNLYVFSQGPGSTAIRRLTNYSGDATWSGVNSVSYGAGFAVYSTAGNVPGAEEVHLIDTANGADRTLASDMAGCVQLLCVGCEHPCVGPVHLTPDGGKVLYAVARNQPFFVVNSDGSGLNRLNLYQGELAPASQRAISRGGVAVFTSSAPLGPTFAAAATEVYAINLDGTGFRQVTKFGNPDFLAANSTISADGAWIAFESNFSATGPQPVNQIWMVRLDGTGLRKLSDGPDVASSPSISADGSVVTFVQGGQVKRIKTTGEATAPLALTSLAISVVRDATVSDDGARVVFTLGPPSGPATAVYRIPTDTPSDARSFLSIYAPRFLSPNGVGSAAGVGAASPGSVFSAYGANFAVDELVQAKTYPLPKSLNGLSLLVNGQAVPILAMTPWQINAQLPQAVPPGPSTFQVRDANGAAAPGLGVTIENYAPVNFYYSWVQGPFSYSQAAAYHAGTGVPADLDHPATAGETLEIYGLGLGVTNPVVEGGLASPSSSPARALQTPRLQIGGRDAVVTFAGSVPGIAGVYQVNAVVPAGLSPGLYGLAWERSVYTLSYSSVAVK